MLIFWLIGAIISQNFMIYEINRHGYTITRGDWLYVTSWSLCLSWLYAFFYIISKLCSFFEKRNKK